MMFADQPTSAGLRRRSTALLIACVAGAALTGCDDRTPAQKALVQSSREINTISGGTGLADPSVSAKKRQNVASTLSGVPTSTPVEVAATMSTLAQTQLGQAIPAKADVVAVEREALLKEALVRGLMSEWASRASLAASLESFDASGAIAELNQSIAAKQKETVEFDARKRELDGKIADLHAKADASNAEGQAAEAEYAKLREQAQALSATQAEPLIARAAAYKRKSDEAHIQAARYLAEADVMSPQSAESAQAVERTANQIKGLEEAKQRLQARMAQSKSEGQAARAEADKVADNLDKAVQEFKAYRSGAMDAAYAALAKAYSTAAGSAKKATEDKSGLSKVALGAAQQAIGDLNWSRAKSEQSFALLMDRLSNLTPELSKRAAYADDSKAAQEAKKGYLEQAKSAYEGAVSAYRASGAKGQVKDQLETVLKRLEAFATAAGDDKLDVLAVLASAEKPAEEAAPDGSSAEKPADRGTPSELAPGESRPLTEAPEGLRRSVEQFANATRDNDVRALREVLVIPAESEEAIDHLLTIQMAQGKLDRACRDKFQQGLAEAMKSMGALGAMGGGVNVKGELDLTGATYSMPSPDTAEISIPGGPQKLTWKLTDGVWKLELGLEKLPPGSLDAIASIAEPLGAAFDEVTADVESGKLQSIQAVGVALMQKLGPILQRSQGGGGGGG